MLSASVVRRYIKPPVFIASALPLLWLVAGAFGLAGVSLGADPIARILHELGLWGLRFICITLAVTPLRWIFNLPWLLMLRRMLGLFAFTYVLLHFLTWLILDQGLYWAGILPDIAKRPYITIGFLAFLMLIPMAITSTQGWMRRLGKRWQTLHKLIYPIALLGVWHFYWQVKKDVTEPLIYLGIVAVLLGYRVWHSRQRRNAAAARMQTAR